MSHFLRCWKRLRTDGAYFITYIVTGKFLTSPFNVPTNHAYFPHQCSVLFSHKITSKKQSFNTRDLTSSSSKYDLLNTPTVYLLRRSGILQILAPTWKIYRKLQRIMVTVVDNVPKHDSCYSSVFFIPLICTDIDQQDRVFASIMPVFSKCCSGHSGHRISRQRHVYIGLIPLMWR